MAKEDVRAGNHTGRKANEWLEGLEFRKILEPNQYANPRSPSGQNRVMIHSIHIREPTHKNTPPESIPITEQSEFSGESMTLYPWTTD